MAKPLRKNKRFQDNPEAYSRGMGFKFDYNGDLTVVKKPHARGLTVLSLVDYWNRRSHTKVIN